MSERKVLNKYYPPDYDPSKIPRARRPKNRQWNIRTMAPFNMRCNTCGEYIYKGKKFNSRQEVAEGETYLGLKIFRFYIRCPKCVSEISFKTDPESVDYVLEAGATRNFEALRTAELMAEKEAKEKEEELANNPMKMLENRTKASQREMDMLEILEDLRELNSKHSQVDLDQVIGKYRQYEDKMREIQEEEDEKFVQSVFGKSGEQTIKRLPDELSDEEGELGPSKAKIQKTANPTDVLTQGTEGSGSGITEVNKKDIKGKTSLKSSISSKASISMMIKKKSNKPTEKNHTSVNSDKNDKTVASVSEQSTTQQSVPLTTLNTEKIDSVNKDNGKVTATENVKSETPAKDTSQTAVTSNGATGLSLLGNYSDTDSSEDG